MNTLVICSCTKNKLDHPATVGEMYRSQILTQIKQFQQSNGYDLIFISSKYGILSPTQIIEPYNQKLSSNKSIEELQTKLKSQIGILKHYHRIIIIMGEKYEKAIIPFVKSLNAEVFKLSKPNGIFDYKKNLKKLTLGDTSVLLKIGIKEQTHKHTNT